MKNITDLIEAIKTSPEFRAKFIGKDEAAIEQILKDEGYDVSMEELAEAAGNVDIELTPEELEKIAGGNPETFASATAMVFIATITASIYTGIMCFAE